MAERRRHWSRERALLVAGAFGLVLLPPLAELAGEGFFVSTAARVLIYALAAASLDLIVGYGAMVSFGHAAFVGIGAYVVAIASFHAGEGTDFIDGLVGGSEQALLLWPLAMLVAGVAAALIGAICLRTSGIHFIMITLAFAQMAYFFFVSLEAYGGDDGLPFYGRNQLPGLDLGDDTTFYYVCLALLAAFLYLSRRLVGARFGMVIRGCRQNERRMRALGFATYRYKLAAFVIAAMGAGLAGALLANKSEFVDPGLLHWPLSGTLLVMVILGGMGTLYGPLLGAAAFLLLEELIAAYTEHWMLYFGPLLVLVVLFARRGLWGLLAGGAAAAGGGGR